MSRPTDRPKTKVIKVRISEELEGLIKSRGDNLSETIRELIKAGLAPQKDNVSQTLKDIESMVVCAGGDLDSFLDDLDFKLTMEIICLKDGLIDADRYEGDKEVEKELADLRMACEEKGVSLAEAVKKAKQGVWGMRQ